MGEIICQTCGTHYYSEGFLGMQCPVCPTLESLLGVKPVELAVDTQAEQKYWDNKRVGLRAISVDIVAQILSRNNAG